MAWYIHTTTIKTKPPLLIEDELRLSSIHNLRKLSKNRLDYLIHLIAIALFKDNFRDVVPLVSSNYAYYNMYRIGNILLKNLI
jgi:hypothetical protein